MGLFDNNDERKQLQAEMQRQKRLPPGQSLTLKWPVPNEGPVPSFDRERWDFEVIGLTEPLKLSHAEFMNLPRIQVTADFRCVTQVSQRNIGRVAMFGVNSHVTCARLGMGELEDFAKRDSFPEVVKLGSLAFFDHDRPGFWEQNGYNMYGDPWKEQRYDTD